MTLEVRVDTSTFETRRGVTTGQIWLELDGVAFPEVGWSDFPVVILSWWLSALSQFESGSATCDLGFMDGPYIARLQHADTGDTVARIIEDEPATSETVFRTTDFRDSLLRTSCAVLELATPDDRDVSKLHARAQAPVRLAPTD